jgi:four helix bundle protein
MTFYFENLAAWKKAFLLTERTFLTIKRFPKEEQYALTDQLRRCSLSIVSNIAEWSGRTSNAEYTQFLSIAKGSCMEYATQIMLAHKFEYLTSEEYAELTELVEEIVKIVSTMIQNNKIIHP